MNKKDITKPVKGKFDTSAFVFNTKVSDLETALEVCHEELKDLLEYVSPDADQKKRIAELQYWLGIWELNMPELKRRKMEEVLTCAQENAALGLYKKTTKRNKKK